mmetsp:Transcript_19655/g.16795  ORF Transcript_19655/g.16795 Transcript_19655/m.16795 type:complete len:87 (-) Transcript_19655:99-359(-)
MKFDDESYLKGLPRTKKDGTTTYDKSKTFFFKQGRSPVYSETVYVFTGFENEMKSKWVALDDFNYQEEFNIAPKALKQLLEDPGVT